MQVLDIMTRDVISVTPDESIDAAIDLMLGQHVSGLPVVDDDGHLVGILTEGDLLRRPELGTQRERSSWRDAFVGTRGAVRKYVHSHGVRVRDVMTPNPQVVTEETSLDEVARLMETRNIKRLPVMRKHALIGMISRMDLIRALVTHRRKANEVVADEKVLREHILEDIAAQGWAEGVVVDVSVRNGVVDLWGTVLGVDQAEALRALIESTPGVHRVEPYLTCNGEHVSMK
jgi:CBS domain-containing protein